MIGTLDRDKRDVTIIGGGLAGMYAAYALDKAGFNVTLYEASNRLGGMIRTNETSEGLVEEAANSLMATPALRGLAADIGMDLEPLSPDAKAKYILCRGKLNKRPLNGFDIIRILYGLFLKKAPVTATTMREFGETHLGSKLTDRLIEPMITGIYGCRSSEIAVAAAFPRIQTPKGMTPYQALKMNGKEFPSTGKRIIVAPKGGMEQMVERLASYLHARLGERLILSSPVDELPEAPNVILSVPASTAAKLIRSESSLLASRLEQIQYAPMLSAGVFVSNAALNHIPKGLGVLMPPVEGRRVLGILFTSSSFSNRVRDPKQSLLTVMMGGTRAPEQLGLSDQEIIDTIRDELRELFGLQGDLSAVYIRRWTQGIPVYNESLIKVWNLARETWCSRPGHVLFGNYAGEVSLRGMLENANRLAQNLPVPVKRTM